MKQYAKEFFMHPLDAQCADKVLNSAVMRQALELAFEQRLDQVFHYACASSCAAFPADSPIHAYAAEGCALFGQPEEPLICLARDYAYDVRCIGFQAPVVVIPDTLLACGDARVIRGRVMAAMASVRAGHHKLFFLMWLCRNVRSAVNLPLLHAPMRLLLASWRRAQQYTVDRAFLLATADYALAQKNILLGEASPDIIAQFRFGEQGTFDAQVGEFYRKDNAADLASAAQAMLQYETWLPAQYQELEKFYQSLEGLS